MREIVSIIVVFVAVIGLLLFADCDNPARADQSWPTWDEESTLALGVCVMAECDFNSEEEASAIGHVLVKRWRMKKGTRTIEQITKSYCALWDKRSRFYYGTRSTRIRHSTWERSSHADPSKWRSLKKWATRFQNRKLSDPCPIAINWGGRNDRIPPTWTCPCKFNERGNRFCYVQR